KSLLELKIERLNRLGNLRFDYLKRFHDPEPIFQGYKENRLEVHLHGEISGTRLCGVFSRFDTHKAVMHDEHKVIVFVQVDQSTQGVSPLDSVVGLQFLDSCYLVSGELADKVIPWVPESLWRAFDRKLCSTFEASKDVQLTDHVIKRFPEIPSGIPNQDSASVGD